MTWYYAVGLQQQGPVTEEQLQALAKDGVITGDTLVWRDGMANWQPYRTQIAPGAIPSTSVGGGVIAAPPSASPAATSSNRVLTEQEFFKTDYSASIGDALSRAWKTFTGNAGVMIGGGLLLLLVGMIGNVIPILGVLIGFVINGPIAGGLYLLYLRCVRGEQASVGDGFAGFGPQFLQLMLGNIVVGLLAVLCVMPGAVLLVIGGFAGSVMRGGGIQTVGGGIAVIGVIVFLIGMLVTIYLSVGWCMTLLLVIDKRLDFWRAMGVSRRRVNQHFFRVLLFLFVSSIISILGVLALGFGLFVTVPLAVAMVACLYEDMFREFNSAPQG